MIRREEGFTLVELMITMVMFVFVIAAVSQIFAGLLTQFKQQSKIAETNIEGIVGLDMMRRDLEHAGYGLPWLIPAGFSYLEVPSGSAGAAYNECAGTCSTVPRALMAGSGAGYNGSDELVIRGTNVAKSPAAQTWTTLRTGDVKINGLSGESFAGTNRVIVLSPGTTTADARQLVVHGTDWATTYDATLDFAPGDETRTFVIYGIDPDNIRMPFNRADYYISTSNVPSRCATNTGVLMKSVLSQNPDPSNGGKRGDFLPILDCVADMQVVFRFDRSVNLDGTSVLVTDDIDALATDMGTPTPTTAQQVRDRLMDVRIYILAHEGQRDPNFTYSTNPVYVGDTSIGNGRNFNFTTIPSPIDDWQNYRWKLYTIVIKPINLR